VYLCLAISLFGGLSIAATWGIRAYVTHVATARLEPTAPEKERLNQLFDHQMSTASGGAAIALFQIIAIFYVRKLRGESSRMA
jgi:hypothetical protein